MGTKSPLDPHEAPPKDLQDVFKMFRKRPFDPDGEGYTDIIDFTDIGLPGLESIPVSRSNKLFERFVYGQNSNSDEKGLTDLETVEVYGSRVVPGLMVLPSLFRPSVQKTLLSRLLHRDLSNPNHKTNLDTHYFIPDPELEARHGQAGCEEATRPSLFSLPRKSPIKFQPKDPELHKPLSIEQALQKKLRWMTLGGQYDWTKKVYPQGQQPDIPQDIADLIGGLFPDMEAQAAIVNIYSPGDTLALHRDVSEEVDRSLVSISLGCDCLFVIGLGPLNEDDGEDSRTQQSSRWITLRLRSGDAVYMSKESRFAWHGVPKIVPGTCPHYLGEWPAEDPKYEEWRGWMRTKRVNLNIRQMRESTAPPRDIKYSRPDFSGWEVRIDGSHQI